MRKRTVLLLTLALALSACSRSKPTTAEPPIQQPPAEQPQEQQLPEGPDLMAIPGPRTLPLDDLLTGLTRYLAQGEGGTKEKLDRLYAKWGLASGEMRTTHVEADLDGDGQPEVVTALNGSGGMTGSGALLVLYEEDGQAAIDRSEALPGVGLFQVADLTGDGEPEILWHSTDVGAHTASTQVFVSRWRPGKIEALPGSMSSTNMRLSVEGEEILLIGGTIGSAGAGAAQRVRTDRYRWEDGAFRLVDQRYEPSDLGYHRLLDGIAAESFGRTADAEQAYREAAEESRRGLAPEMVPPESAANFNYAVRTFARFRLGALLLEAGKDPGPALEGATGPYAGLLTVVAQEGDRAAYCRTGESWARQTPGFLEALNSPFGYANPRWAPGDLCGPIPAAE